MNLPPGFVLDNAAQPQGLPQGFVLDAAPVAKPLADGRAPRSVREDYVAPDVGYGGALGTAIQQGATLGTADEIKALNEVGKNAFGIRQLEKETGVKVKSGPIGTLLGAGLGGIVAGAQYLFPKTFGTESLDVGAAKLGKEQDAVSEGERQYPLTTLGGNIAGGLAVPVGPVRNAYEGVKTGATLGGLYGFFTGDDFADRANKAAVGATIGGGVGGIGGKIAERFAPKAAVAPVAAADDAARMGVPLTAGQKYANPALIAKEDQALGGGLGERAQTIAQEAVKRQQAAIGEVRDAIGGAASRGGEPLERVAQAGEIVGDTVRNVAAAKRQDYKALYDAAFAKPGEFAPDALRGISTRITDDLVSRAEPVIIDDTLTPIANAALKKLNDIQNLKLGSIGQPGAGEQIVGLSLRGVDQARRQLVSFYKGAKANPTDARAVGAIINSFDDQVERAMVNGLFSGSDDALKAIKDARSSFASYQRAFRPQGAGDDAGNALRHILDRDATPEEVARYLYGTAKTGARGVSVRLADRLEKIFGKSSDEWSAIRQGAWMHVAGGSEGQTQAGAQKMATRIMDFIDGEGRSLSHRLFSPQELGEMRRFAGVLRATIGPPGTQNARSSNSGNRMLAGINNMIAKGAETTLAGAGGAVGGFAGAGAGAVAGRALSAAANYRAGKATERLYSGALPGDGLAGVMSNRMRELGMALPAGSASISSKAPSPAQYLLGPHSLRSETDQEEQNKRQ